MSTLRQERSVKNGHSIEIRRILSLSFFARLSWQVVPTALARYLNNPDRKKADRAMQAMMKMKKIVIADLDKAYAG
jgi:hypothetical protein